MVDFLNRHYEEDEELIYCLTDDKKYNYVFYIIDEETLSFNTNESSPLNLINFSLENEDNFILDGAIFKLEK